MSITVKPKLELVPFKQFVKNGSSETSNSRQIVQFSQWLLLLDLDNFTCVTEAIKTLENEIQVDLNGTDYDNKISLLKLLKDQQKKTDEYKLYRDFFTFVLLSAFKTAETIIHRLADTPTRKLNRRFKYAWTQLKHNADGTVSHNFIHNVGNVPAEYQQQVETKAKEYMKPNMLTKFAPYFQSEEVSEKNTQIENMIISDTMRDDDILGDVYTPDNYDDSPCSVHDGLKLRSDCVICKAILPQEDRPVIISKAFMKKINVTENLLKFLAIQQDKRKAQEAENRS